MIKIKYLTKYAETYEKIVLMDVRHQGKESRLNKGTKINSRCFTFKSNFPFLIDCQSEQTLWEIKAKTTASLPFLTLKIYGWEDLSVWSWYRRCLDVYSGIYFLFFSIFFIHGATFQSASHRQTPAVRQEGSQLFCLWAGNKNLLNASTQNTSVKLNKSIW